MPSRLVGSRFENRSYGERLVSAHRQADDPVISLPHGSLRLCCRSAPGRAIGGDTQSRFENRSYGWIGILIGVKASSRLENPA